MRSIAVIAAVFALTGGAVPGGAQAQKLRVGLAGADYFGYTHVTAAQELGLFKAQGVEVEVVSFRGAGPAQEALAAGSMDVVNNAPVGAVLAADKGVKLKIVGSNLFERPVGFKLLVKTGSPIKSLKDLDGRKIGITSKGSGTDIVATWVTQHARINTQLVPVGGGLAAALNSGQVDAIPMWATVSYRLLVTKQADLLLDIPATLETIPDLWIASAEAIEKNPKAVRGFLVAIMQGAERIRSDRKYGMEVMKRWTKETDEKALALAYDDFVKFGRTDAVVTRRAFDESIRVADAAGIKTQPNAYDRTVDTRFFPISTR
jgi:NitT/TauT family transport system substrate-binding protein